MKCIQDLVPIGKVEGSRSIYGEGQEVRSQKDGGNFLSFDIPAEEVKVETKYIQSTSVHFGNLAEWQKIDESLVGYADYELKSISFQPTMNICPGSEYVVYSVTWWVSSSSQVSPSGMNFCHLDNFQCGLNLLNIEPLSSSIKLHIEEVIAGLKTVTFLFSSTWTESWGCYFITLYYSTDITGKPN